ncbi:Proteins of 100 residues with WXG [Anaerosporobacter mobilis DSM 15930]|jgi:uncharacterized protein YukE|uniref:Proteins of 100 residues with WXG n=1 Tax=Anaerosporobacter mobilis DSM 15930 TaxID=1120996 RepID=A0A1M7N2R8_9FIRM|nr:WXG100 family type VII secretion target [Anaerosporobacter mobilis]MBS5935272.1 WXG100 family type VII secretion target [Clostridiales bacterium]SHM97818.1 Proteins of 100 residues with WXG [Anaerosporobacter mobilis DSM 15930]
MAMGKTSTVNITPEMMNNALNVISDYRKKTVDLHTQLSDTVATLIPSNFSGNAADGFKIFYENKIEPAVGEGLTNLLDSLQKMCEGILQAIPQDSVGLDDQLAEENKK